MFLHAITGELKKPKPRDSILLPLIKSTYQTRRLFILHEARDVQNIFEKWPSLKCQALVRFVDIIHYSSEFYRLSKNFKVMRTANPTFSPNGKRIIWFFYGRLRQVVKKLSQLSSRTQMNQVSACLCFQHVCSYCSFIIDAVTNQVHVCVESVGISSVLSKRRNYTALHV